MASDALPLVDDKRALRRAMSDRRAALPADERVRRSAAACARLAALPEVASARVVAGFAALRAEIDPAAALDELRRRGVVVVLPRVSAEVPRLRFHAAPPVALRAGAYGVLEPDAATPELPLEAIEALVLPGLAFDAAGRRLGYGGGYYDEVAAAARAAGGRLVGFAFDFQIVDACPAGEGDVPVDCVVTDGRVLRRKDA